MSQPESHLCKKSGKHTFAPAVDVDIESNVASARELAKGYCDRLHTRISELYKFSINEMPEIQNRIE